MAPAKGTKRKALVTGGAGFLGRHLIQQLLDSGDYEVTCFDLRVAHLPGCASVAGDLSNAGDVAAAVTGMGVVFHAATAAPTAQNAARARDLMNQVNIVGTQNVIDACRKHGVPQLIYTSSASVVFSGRPLIDVDESHPYADPPMDFYTGTKAEAEQLVLAANSASLASCALRPSGIFGDGDDKLLVPSVVSRARAGKMRYIIGPGDNLFDWTYVGNVAAAHLAAASRLTPGSPVAGQAYFITNLDPYPFWAMMGDLCAGLGYARPSIHLPVWLMLCVAFFASLLSRVFGIVSDLNPMRIRIASVQRTYVCAKAVRDLGYQPSVSVAEATRRTVAHFAHLANPAAGTEPAAKKVA